MVVKHPHFDPVFISRILFFVVIALAVFFGGTTWYLNNQLHKLQSTKSAVLAMKSKPKAGPLSVVDQIGKLMDLPQGEDPVIATVTDPSKLEDQQFFSKAKAGDKVVVYPKAKLAILYRPSTGKIIEAGPGMYKPSNPTPDLTQAEPSTTLSPTKATVQKQGINTVLPTGSPTATVSPTPSSTK